MIKQFVPQEFCLKCQGCCRYREENSVWSPCLLDEEILELADKSDIPAVTISADKRLHPVADPQKENFICPFLSTVDNKCRIYSFRPFECQLYPFLINLRDKRIVLTVDLNCPYAKSHLNTKESKEYLDYLIPYLNSPKLIKMLKDNPQLIAAYEDVAEIIEFDLE